MSAALDFLTSRLGLRMARARGKILASQDRRLKSRLIELRRASNLTQNDVAELIGVTQQAVQKFERYDSDPKASTLRRYANAVGAIVEHQVVRDVGQSIELAGPSTWKTSGQSVTIVQTGPRPSISHAQNEWTTMKRTDFALAG
ncbi:helix-turn-helix domain-containing protein [Curtobacterium pusillum]|uniref:helix-turn-helix domain-containing protein n=1 Tax=Curtobacterium pusillum TaxID=69373 RepID=UPI0021B1F46F|nr:helix-turn-helix transcriptional regulator [Curtobacterium pusillum]